jgi:CRISPR-associated endonuclease/helicase Cas3
MLLAKSQYEVNGKSICKGLAEHCREAMDAFEALFGTTKQPTRLANVWLRFFRLSKDAFYRFHATGVVACGLHDVGKANDGFQALVGNGKAPQVIRHEHLSGLLLASPDTMEWLRSLPNVDAEIALSAVIAHHLKAEHKEFAKNLSPGGDVFCVHSEDVEFHAIFRQVSERVGGSDFLPKVEKVWSLYTGTGFDAGKMRNCVREMFYQLTQTLNKKGEDKTKTPTARHRLLMAVRAGVILADAAGSGLPRNNLPIDEWIRRQFPEDEPITAEDIQEKIIAPRITQIERKSGSKFTPKDFQTAASGLSERALMLASCGSGKTMAAWFWIQSQLRRRTVSRVIFLYPTRATATEGFKDYVSWAPEADAALLSRTAAYELDGMFDQPNDERCGKDFTVEERLYSLAFWQKRIFSATVDQFLGFMQHAYGSVCLLPVLADAVVVFDEVHSFDQKLFSTLKQFLKNFDVPTLCMTASLPGRRREELAGLGLEIFPGMERFQELDALAGHPRYQVEALDSENEAMDIAVKAFESGKRVLWVVNTVERCQRIAKKLNALCYHSRFLLKDRKERHEKVIAEFQQIDRPAIAVTTQVCEMSLDLDADVLISEYAPITALIQRLGRCNRNAKIGEEKRGEAYLYAPESDSPYNKSDMEGVTAFVNEIITASDVSQFTLEALLECLGPKLKEKDALCRFLADGFWATSEPLRGIEDHLVAAVLDDDVNEYLALKKDKKPADGLLISIPEKFGAQDWRLGKHILRAPSAHYKAEYGFSKTPYAVIC